MTLSSSLPPMRLTERDRQILETIHAFDGMLSLKQVDRLFFSGQGRSQPRARMRALIQNGYVSQPPVNTRHRIPLGESIYWLNTKGAALVAGLQGQQLKYFRWRNQPRYSLITHDLAVNDFRIAVLKACQANQQLTLNTWIPEHELSLDPDTITYFTPSGKSRKRQIRPDGFLSVTSQLQPNKTFGFLLEIDRGTEDNPRFAREKVRPGMAYLAGQAYEKRFGTRQGRWLVVTTGERRMRNMLAQTEQAGGSGSFYFTTFAAIHPETVFHQPIWWLAGKQEPQKILPDMLVGNYQP